jgi:ADP-ribose pyrophosphatase YjhB (NUDIX family)
LDKINITIPDWLKWAREIQQLSQTGLAFAVTSYERQRYEKLMEISSEIVEHHTNLEKDSLKKIFMEHPGYATPKVDVRAAVINTEGKILLVQESTDLRWAMPGGWADVGDIPSEVAIREAKEESGFEVKPKKVIGVFDANRVPNALEFFHAYKIIFLCELQGGEAATSDETVAVNFFSFDKLPALSFNRTNTKHIDEIILHLQYPERPAYFD